MAGMIDILGSLLQQGMTQSGNTRVSNTVDSQNTEGSLGDILGSLGSLLGGNSASGTGADNLKGMLGDVLGKLADNGAAAGGIGALIGSILGGGSSSAKGAVGGGMLAVLASLALNALKNAGQTPQQDVQALTADPEEMNDKAKIIIFAMINAAKADGKLDKEEADRIIGKLGSDGLEASEKAYIEKHLQGPMDTEALVSAAQMDETMPAQIYAASLLAIEVDTDVERDYMDELASALELDTQVVDYIKTSMGMQA